MTRPDRILLFSMFEPELPPHERCARFLALPDHVQRRYWTDLAEADAERRVQERALGMHDCPYPTSTRSAR